jgi:hypothetical protein
MIALAANKLFMRSKFKKALLANFDLMIGEMINCEIGGQIFDHEIKTQKSIITNFHLMIVLVTNKSIMRSKLKIKHY